MAASKYPVTPRKSPLPAVVRIAWFDAWSEDEWLTRIEVAERLKNLRLVETVGYLIADLPGHVAVATSIDPDAEDEGSYLHGLLVVPRAMLADGPIVLAPAREAD